MNQDRLAAIEHLLADVAARIEICFSTIPPSPFFLTPKRPHPYCHFADRMAGFHQGLKEGTEVTLRHFYRAIELDPDFAAAYGMAARMYVVRISR
jgi:hypothetical protein